MAGYGIRVNRRAKTVIGGYFRQNFAENFALRSVGSIVEAIFIAGFGMVSRDRAVLWIVFVCKALHTKKNIDSPAIVRKK